MHLQWEKEALTPEAFTKEGPLFHSASPLPPPHAFQGPRRGRCSRFSINFFLRLSVKMLLLSWRMVRLWGGCTKEGFDVNVTVTRAFLIDEFLHVFFFFFLICLINWSRHIHDDEEDITVIHIISTLCQTLLKSSFLGAQCWILSLFFPLRQHEGVFICYVIKRERAETVTNLFPFTHSSQ